MATWSLLKRWKPKELFPPAKYNDDDDDDENVCCFNFCLILFIYF
jgi:hypothetical protein